MQTGAGDHIRAARALRGWNRDQLGAAIGMHRDALRRVEAGETRATRQIIEAVQTATEVPMWFLEHGFNRPGEAHQ